jgi:Mlc titration factor MtfA (ptsG expression regulator)
MLLHELAHAYHFLTLGEKYEPLQTAYKQAMERKLYDSVEFVTGGKKKAYATTNAAEYFAELSEAYFGKNDFAPFTRPELEKHDPVGFEMLKKAWGEPNTPSK